MVKLSDKSRQILKLISAGHSYEQILSLHSDYTYKDIFISAEEALELDSPKKSSYQERIKRIKQRYANAYEPWTDEQEEILEKMHNDDAPIQAIAFALKRQPGAIKSRIQKLNLDSLHGEPRSFGILPPAEEQIAEGSGFGRSADSV